MNNNPYEMILSLLNNKGVNYKLINHEPTYTSAESAEARAKGGSPEAIGSKAILTKMSRGSGIEYNVLVCPNYKKIDSKALKSNIKDLNQFRFVTREEMLALTGLVPGSMPPFAKQVFPQLSHLFIDSELLKHPVLGFNAATLTCSLVISCSNYLKIVQPTAMFQFAI